MKYAVNKILREVILSDDARERFKQDPQRYLAELDLTSAESAAIVTHDYPALYSEGAHPFLITSFALRFWPRAEVRQRMLEYVGALADRGYPDYST